MVAWFQNPQYGPLYLLAQEMGAPEFNSEAELILWFYDNFDSIKSRAVRNRRFFLMVRYEGTLTAVRYLWGAVLTRFNLVLTSVQQQESQTVKALRSHLRLNPHSLHPIESAIA
jgi:hypothetical protein